MEPWQAMLQKAGLYLPRYDTKINSMIPVDLKMGSSFKNGDYLSYFLTAFL